MLTLEKENYHHSINTGCLQEQPPPICHSQILGILCSSRYFVTGGNRVEDLADGLRSKENISAVAVVNENHEIYGIIPRKKLFDTLGRRYGRDLNKNKNVEQIADKVTILNYKTNIFSLTQNHGMDYTWNRNNYYCLDDDNGRFIGIISDWDILKYLSHITQEDVTLASKLQSCILKEIEEHSNNSFNVLGSTRMAKGVGGDFYMIRETSEGKFLSIIGDVSGKGIAASLLSVTLSGMMEVYDYKNGIECLIENLNAFFYKTFNGSQFITALFMDFDDDKGKAKIYSLGHSYLYLKRANRIFNVKLNKGTIPLGIDPEIDIQGVSLKLSRDDLLIAITDGFDEQRNPQGEEYGEKQLIKGLNKYGNMDINSLREKLMYDLDKFRGTQPQQDDITMMLIKCIK